jgi:hypothetical protein
MKCIYFEKIDTSVGNDAFDHPTYKSICRKHNCETLEYYCTKCTDRIKEEDRNAKIHKV